MTRSSRITVLVTAHQDSPGLSRCLLAVAKQAEPLGARVLLVVNLPEGQFPATSQQALSKLCSDILFVPTPGKSKALNAGVAACDSEVIAFTDDDAQPQEGWLESLTAPLLALDRPERLVGTGGTQGPKRHVEAPHTRRLRRTPAPLHRRHRRRIYETRPAHP